MSANRQLIVLFLATVASQLATALMFVFTARESPPHEFGLLVSIVGISLSAVSIMDFGTSSYWVRELASGRLTGSDMGGAMASRAMYAGVAGTVAGVAATLLVGPTGLAAIPLILFGTVTLLAQVVLRGAQRTDLVAYSMVADRGVALSALFIALRCGLDPIASLACALAIGGLAGIALASIFSRRIGLNTRLRMPVRNPWTGAGSFGLATTATSLQASDIALLSALAGSNAGGVYGAVSRWTQPLGMLASTYSQTLAPQVAAAPSGRDAIRVMSRSVWMLAVAICGCLIAVVAADPLVALLLGPSYRNSAAVFQLLAIATIPAIVNQPLVMAMQFRGRQETVARVLAIGTALQFGTLATLASSQGALSACYAAIVSQGSVLILMTFAVGKTLRTGKSR